jgi:hypothetical protein
VQVRAGFEVNADDVRTGARESLDIALGLADHEVRVDRQLRGPTHRLDHHRPERDVRHEMPVHHVHVDDVSASCLDRSDFLREPAKVGAQDGGRDAKRQG